MRNELNEKAKILDYTLGQLSSDKIKNLIVVLGGRLVNTTAAEVEKDLKLKIKGLGVALARNIFINNIKEEIEFYESEKAELLLECVLINSKQEPPRYKEKMLDLDSKIRVLDLVLDSAAKGDDGEGEIRECLGYCESELEIIEASGDLSQYNQERFEQLEIFIHTLRDIIKNWHLLKPFPFIETIRKGVEIEKVNQKECS